MWRPKLVGPLRLVSWQYCVEEDSQTILALRQSNHSNGFAGAWRHATPRSKELRGRKLELSHCATISYHSINMQSKRATVKAALLTWFAHYINTFFICSYGRNFLDYRNARRRWLNTPSLCSFIDPREYSRQISAVSENPVFPADETKTRQTKELYNN